MHTTSKKISKSSNHTEADHCEWPKAVGMLSVQYSQKILGFHNMLTTEMVEAYILPDLVQLILSLR